MDIADHPIWKQVTPYKTKIPAYKKPFHLARIALAKKYASLYPKDRFVAITGSVGKTTCAQACLAVLSQKYKVVGTKPNLDPVLNIPLTLLKLNPTVKKVVLEMGIEFKGEMDFYLSLVTPKTAIVTRIAQAHSEFLGELEDIINEKGKLVRQLPKDGVAILNWDDPNSKKLAGFTKATVYYFGEDEKNCMVWASNIRIENFKTIFELNYGVERVEVELKLLGEHQIYPILAAATLGINEGISLIKIKKALESLVPAEHRFQVRNGPNDSIVIDDTFNSSPVAAEAALDVLMQIPARRRILVLGEMKELGKSSESLHRQLAGKIYKEKIDLVFLGSGDTDYVYDELQKMGFLEERMEKNLQNSQLVSRLLKILSKGDICLIKGSRGVRLDEVVSRIAKKS